ncbi:MAG: GIY-YIG nuclease family protein, partial [Lactobacillus sp.]|nr:GIY-YIG nuclease family protein [Lactobacillus sp.]
ESSLHTYFKEYRVNRVNKRKEYFKVPMNKIKEVLAKHKELTFDFNEYPDAYEYRDTLYIEEHEKEKTATSAVM